MVCITIRQEGPIFRALVPDESGEVFVSETGATGWEAVGRLLYHHGPILGIAEVAWEAGAPERRKPEVANLEWLARSHDEPTPEGGPTDERR